MFLPYNELEYDLIKFSKSLIAIDNVLPLIKILSGLINILATETEDESLTTILKLLDEYSVAPLVIFIEQIFVPIVLKLYGIE